MSLTKKNSLLVNLAVLTVVLVIAGLVAEITVRWMFPEAKAHGLQHVMKDKLISFEPGSSAVYDSSEYHVVFDVNRFGRRDNEWTDEALQNPENILLVGDSMVLGYGLLEEYAIDGIMEKAFRAQGKQIEVFNYGMGGAISIPEYEKLMEDALASGIQADRIVVGIFTGNDFTPPSAVVSQCWLDKSAFYRWVKRRVASSPFLVDLLFRTGKIFRVDVYQSPENFIFLREMKPEQKAAVEAILKNLNTMNQKALTEQRKLSVVIFPSKLQVENAAQLDNARYRHDGPDKIILDYCQAQKLRCLDLLPALKKEYEASRQPLYFPVDRHLNPLGAAVAAREIKKFIEGGTA